MQTRTQGHRPIWGALVMMPRPNPMRFLSHPPMPARAWTVGRPRSPTRGSPRTHPGHRRLAMLEQKGPLPSTGLVRGAVVVRCWELPLQENGWRWRSWALSSAHGCAGEEPDSGRIKPSPSGRKWVSWAPSPRGSLYFRISRQVVRPHSLTDVDETLTGGAAAGPAYLARKARGAAVARAADNGAEVTRVVSQIQPQARLPILTDGAVTFARFSATGRTRVALAGRTGRDQQQ